MCTEVRRIAEDAPSKMGVSIRFVGFGSVLEYRSGESYSLGSVNKIPLMASLSHNVSKGELKLGHRFTPHEDDKSIGSSDILFFDAGTQLSLNDLCYLIFVHSDNTATDMIHCLLGLDATKDYMCPLGLRSFDVHCPCCEGFLLPMNKFIGLAAFRPFRG